MTFFARLFPSYVLMESALLASRRETEDLRTELNIARDTVRESKARYEEERAELKALRIEHTETLKQTANFMAYAKTARMIFVEPGSSLPLPAPPVSSEQLGGRVSMRDRTAQVLREFHEATRTEPEQVAA